MRCSLPSVRRCRARHPGGRPRRPARSRHRGQAVLRPARPDLTSWPAVSRRLGPAVGRGRHLARTSRPARASTTSPGWTRWCTRRTRTCRGDPGAGPDAGLLRTARAAAARRCRSTSGTGSTTSRAVVTHYSPANWGGIRGIAAYQVWNEANIVNFWTGTPLQMAQLTKAAWNTVKARRQGRAGARPGATRRGSPSRSRASSGSRSPWVNGVPVWRCIDAISLNLYPLDKYGTTRDAGDVDGAARAGPHAMLGCAACRPPSRSGTPRSTTACATGGPAPRPISAEQQAAYVLRTFLLNAANGVQRVDWYAWDMGYLPNGSTLGNTRLTDPSTGAPDAGRQGLRAGPGLDAQGHAGRAEQDGHSRAPRTARAPTPA